MNVQWFQFGLAVIVFIGGCFGVAIRIGYIVASTVSQITTETDAKIGLVHERFDKYKDQLEGSFVRRESCTLSHNSTAQALGMASTEYRRAHEELKTTLLRLNDKVDTLLMREK